jgi:hypothetical protein
MTASKFKEECLKILDHLDPEGIVITKHSKPAATPPTKSSPPPAWFTAFR